MNNHILSKKFKGKKNPNYRHGKTNNNKCIDCDKKIWYKSIRCRSCDNKYRYNNLSYKNNVSKKVQKAMKKIKKWEGKDNPRWKNGLFKKNNPNWQGGINKLPYSFDFNNELKEQIRKRDDYECQGENCGITEEEHIIVYGRILTIHHIDYDKENTEKDNLTSLCCQCNSRVNFNRDYWKEYFKCKVKK